MGAKLRLPGHGSGWKIFKGADCPTGGTGNSGYPTRFGPLEKTIVLRSKFIVSMLFEIPNI